MLILSCACAAIHCAAISAAERQAAQKLAKAAEEESNAASVSNAVPSVDAARPPPNGRTYYSGERPENLGWLRQNLSAGDSPVRRPASPSRSQSSSSSSSPSASQLRHERRATSIDAPESPLAIRPLRRSVDSMLRQRMDSAMLLNESEVIPEEGGSSRASSHGEDPVAVPKSTSKIGRRLRDMLRNLFT